MSRSNLSAWAVAHPTLILFLILMVAGAGAFSYAKLGRAEDPSFTIKTVVISAVWPGATAQEMQFQVADRIEKKLQELPWFDVVKTYSKPGIMLAQLEFRDSTPPAQVPWLFYLTRRKMADVKSDLPDGVIGPNVNDEYGDVDSILYTLRADGADYAQLKLVAESARQRLLKVPNVTKVTIYGTQEERIFVNFDHVKIASLGIGPQAILDSLAKQNAVVPAGIVQTDGPRIPLRVTGAFDGVETVKNTPVASANGTIVRLGDIVTVTREYVDPPDSLLRQRGAPALALGIVMQKGANILTLGEDVDAAMAEIMRATPVGFTYERIANQPKIVEEAVGDFMRSFVEALVIVLAVSFLSLGMRTGIVVALSVPLVLGLVFIIMLIIGLDLHRITLGALIIALGLMVDDAIISIEMMLVKMEQGVARAEAAGWAWTSTAFPRLTGALVTAAGFLPIGFAVSSTGEYAGAIFTVVGIALLASWLVAGMFTPYLGMKLLPNVHVHHDADPNAIYDTPMYRRLRVAIRWCVDHCVWVVGATVAAFVMALVGFGHIPQQFFPTSERTELFVQLRMPEGSAIGATLAAAKKAEQLIAGDDDAATWTTYVGSGPPRFWLGLNPALPNEAYAEIVIVAKRHQGAGTAEEEDRHRGCEWRRRRGARANRSLQFRAAGRFPGPVPRHRHRPAQSSRCCLSGSRRPARQPRCDRASARLGRADAIGQARARPGPHPRARARPADGFREPAGDRHGLSRDHRARPDREGRGGGPRDREPAQRSRLDRRPHGSGAQRRAGSGLAGRSSRAGARGCDLLAPQPRPHDDRAR